VRQKEERKWIFSSALWKLSVLFQVIRSLYLIIHDAALYQKAPASSFSTERRVPNRSPAACTV
jgi:hypothetical protein